MKFSISKYIIKPALATGIMATILAIGVAVIVYVLAIVALKVFNKEEIQSLPAGNKICTVLEKLKIY